VSAPIVKADDPLIAHVCAIRETLLERGQAMLSLTLGAGRERALVVIAVDERAVELRDAIRDAMGYPVADWPFTPVQERLG